MKVTSGYEERRARIELVPLIDCMFLLLVFFVYASMRMTVLRGLPVRLPAGSGPAQPHAVVVTLRADNTFWLDDRPLPLDEAAVETARRAQREQKPVLISGDQAAELGPALELLSRLREAGIESVSFRVRRDMP